MEDKEYIKNISSESSDELIDNLFSYGHDFYYDDLWRATVREIAKRLKVDAVEVVRCRDCLYGKHKHQDQTDCYYEDLPTPHEPEFFCGYGIRREQP